MTDAPDETLAALVGDPAVPFRVEHHVTIESTNDRAVEAALAGEQDVAVVADRQTGGYGRRGREWRSPAGGIWLSVVLRPELPPERTQLLTLAGALGVVAALREAGIESVIKWPNDVLAPDPGWSDRKLAGVLTRTGETAAGDRWAVVGIGLNADVDPADLPTGATSLRTLATDIDRVAIVRRLLSMMDRLRDDPETILDTWRRDAETLGMRIRVETADGSIVGTAVDVDETGALRVETETGTKRVTASACEHLRPT